MQERSKKRKSREGHLEEMRKQESWRRLGGVKVAGGGKEEYGREIKVLTSNCFFPRRGNTSRKTRNCFAGVVRNNDVKYFSWRSEGDVCHDTLKFGGNKQCKRRNLQKRKKRENKWPGDQWRSGHGVATLLEWRFNPQIPYIITLRAGSRLTSYTIKKNIIPSHNTIVSAQLSTELISTF